MIPLPALSDPDPELAGEGSIDPLGLGAFADRLAELLAPDVRARMVRIRFVTAIAVGSMVSEELWEEPPADGISTPAVCFEWLVLEAFARKRDIGVLQATGIPGSAKTQAVITQGKRLNASNYLKTPSVFGFNGVYQPLARGLRVVDDERLPAERATSLVATWEAEQGFSGFLDRRRGTEGAGLRSRLEAAVRDALHEGRCTVSVSAHLWEQLARSLGPMHAGRREAAQLRDWLLTPEVPIRRELAMAVSELEFESEHDLLEAVEPHGSPLLRQRAKAVFAYENVCRRLDAIFSTWRYISTMQGTQPLTPAAASGNPVIEQAANELPDACARMREALEPLDMLLPAENTLGVFADRWPAGELVERVLEHHYSVQGSKNKRAWFEEYGAGVIVRPMYRRGDPVDIDDRSFLHPFRVTPLRQFMKDTNR